MTMNRLAIAVVVGVALAAAPMAAQARKHRLVRHQIAHHHLEPYLSTAQSTTYQGLGISAPRPGTYGSSGVSVGTVTAPSVGSYNWPSVGVTNSVPTWSNTNPPVGR